MFKQIHWIQATHFEVVGDLETKGVGHLDVFAFDICCDLLRERLHVRREYGDLAKTHRLDFRTVRRPS
jgi:hypothetical protein